MPSTLIVFYSYTGTSRRVAQLLAAQQGWPVGEIIEEHPRAGAKGTLRCLLDSLLGREPPVRYEGPEPGGFDQVVLVAPVWVYQLAGPMRSFIARFWPRLPHYAIVTTMNARGAENVEGSRRESGRRGTSRWRRRRGSMCGDKMSEEWTRKLRGRQR